MTLYHLYTIAGLILALALVFRLFRCAHGWELVDRTEFKSVYDKMPAGHMYYRSDFRGLSRNKIVIVMRCAKCGAAKVFEIWSH